VVAVVAVVAPVVPLVAIVAAMGVTSVIVKVDTAGSKSETDTVGARRGDESKEHGRKGGNNGVADKFHGGLLKGWVCLSVGGQRIAGALNSR
jgi:hypothetical protein